MLRLDMGKVSNGVEFDYFEQNRDGSTPKVKLSMLGNANQRYQKRLDAITRPHRRKLQMGALSEKEAQALFRQAFIECILIGWSNVQPDDDGTNLPFSYENAETVLANPEFQPFYDWMQAEASNLENFRQERLESEVKN